MKSFLQYLLENLLEKPISWDDHYGKSFRVVETPKDQTGGEHRISIVTPSNREAWNWKPASEKTIQHFKDNWETISKSLDPHKIMQIHTGRLHVKTDEEPYYKEVTE